MLALYLLYIYEKEHEPLFEQLYVKYNRALIKASYYILKNKEDAEDATQAAWIAIAKHMSTLCNLDNEKLEIYIFKVVKSKSVNLYTKKKNSIPCFNLDDFTDTPANDDIENEYFQHELYEIAVSYLSNMKSCYRDVLTLYFLCDMTPTQIAESLGRPFQTVKSQLKRGKLQLLKEFGEKTHD